MTVRITPEALEVIRRSLALAESPDMGVRLRMAGGAVRPRFAADPEAGDVVIEQDGVRIFVAESIARGDVEIGVTPEHETLVVRPIGSDDE